MAVHSFEVDIAAPPELVYDIWVDPERIPEWTEGLTSVSDISGVPGQTGTRFTARFGRTRAAVEVTVGDRPRRYAWGVRLGPLAAEFDTRFDRSATGTRMTETVRTRGFIAWLWNRILSTGSYHGSFRGELQAFASIVEGELADRNR